MTPIDLLALIERLEVLAEKATPGPRFVGIAYDYNCGPVPPDYEAPGYYDNIAVNTETGTVVGCDEYDVFESRADADFIAATDPATIKTLCTELRARIEREQSALQFPKHKAALYLTHNEHKSVYQTVENEILEGRYDFCEWVSPEQREKAIATNEAWTLQWYPDTPVGFCALAAADLSVLLAAALAEQKDTTT